MKPKVLDLTAYVIVALTPVQARMLDRLFDRIGPEALVDDPPPPRGGGGPQLQSATELRSIIADAARRFRRQTQHQVEELKPVGMPGIVGVRRYRIADDADSA